MYPDNTSDPNLIAAENMVRKRAEHGRVIVILELSKEDAHVLDHALSRYMETVHSTYDSRVAEWIQSHLRDQWREDWDHS